MGFIIFVIIIIFIFLLKRSKKEKYNNQILRKSSNINNSDITKKTTENEFIEKLLDINIVSSSSNNNSYFGEIENKKLYNSVAPYLKKLNDLQRNFENTFFPYEYTKNTAQKNEYKIKEYYDISKKLIELAELYGYKNKEKLPEYLKYQINEFSIYNMAQCYYYQKRFKEAQQVFLYAFDNINFFDDIHNLRKSYIDFIKLMLNSKEIELAFSYIDDISKKIELENKFIEEISSELSELLEVKIFFIKFTKSLKNINIQNIISYKIIREAEIQVKVYKNLEYSETSFKGKDYEKAKKYFEIAVENALNFNENIKDEFELYGDILYKLKEYKNSIEAYVKSNYSNHYRIFCKLGDAYKMDKENEKAFENYLLALYYNPDYKTAQTKLITISKKLNKDIDIDITIKKIKNNKDKKFEEIMEII